MLFDANGRARHEGTVVKELTWGVFDDSALPSWLELIGAGAASSFSTVNSAHGYATVTTSGADGAFAGLAPAFDIDTAEFTEIGFFAEGVFADASANGTNSSTQLYIGDKSTTGALLQNTGSGSGHEAEVFGGTAQGVQWRFHSDDNAPKRKNIGMIIRPTLKEVFFTSGDPAQGDAAISYDIGNWSDLTAAPCIGTLARSAAARSLSISKITLRLAHY